MKKEEKIPGCAVFIQIITECTVHHCLLAAATSSIEKDLDS